MKTICGIATVVAVVLVAACGGGGGNERPQVGTGEIHTPAHPEVQHLPFPMETGDIRHVGIDQASSSLGRLPSAGERGDLRIRYGSPYDGAGQETVAAYLSEAAVSEVVSRFPVAPLVRLADASTAREAEIVATVVDAINLSLPAHLQMKIGPPGGFAFDTIDVSFLSCAEYGRCDRAAASTSVQIRRDTQGEQIGRRADISFSRESVSYGDDRLASILMAHEFLHALGIDNHVSARFDSIMQASLHYSFATPSILSPLDREALSALYGRLDPGDAPTAFGPWARSSLHIAGNGKHANFGVALRNGYAEPWAHGPAPTATLADNRALGGSATWTGTLLGLTPDAAAVVGDAEIGVNLGTMAGRADFTNLETWGANAAPGDAGTGVQWLDGDLGYMIAVRGNGFRGTGGDDGELTGVFTGRQHEGAAGILERSDLTASFGASR